jgi:uncharacterized protein YjaG (DUF416 family)
MNKNIEEMKRILKRNEKITTEEQIQLHIGLLVRRYKMTNIELIKQIGIYLRHTE